MKIILSFCILIMLNGCTTSSNLTPKSQINSIYPQNESKEKSILSIKSALHNDQKNQDLYILLGKEYIKYNNFPWPKIYTLSNKEENIKKTFSKISDKNGKVIYYYSGGQECMYSKSPCSNYNRKLIKKYINNYSIFYLEKN